MKTGGFKHSLLAAVLCLVMALTSIGAAGLGRQTVLAADEETELVLAEQEQTASEEDDDPEADYVRMYTTEESTENTVLKKSSSAAAVSVASTTETTTSGSTDSDELAIKAYGIDVSKYQGEIDWTKVKAAGVSFAIIRVGYRGYSGGTIAQDSYAIENLEGALEAGLEVGVYFFSTALNEKEAVEEAQFVLDIIEDYDITYPVVYDCEGYDNSSYRNYGLSSTVRTNNAIAFLNYVEAAGYQGMMYGSANALKNDTSWETSTMEQYYDIWVAQYYYYTSSTQYPSYSTLVNAGKTTSYTGNYRFWQFTSQGSVDGISGYVDLDIEYVTDDCISESDVVEDTGEIGTDTDATAEYTTGWVRDGEGNTYYYDDGIMQTGFLVVDGYTYYFAADGVMQTGLTRIDGKIYYFTYKGVMWTGWVRLNDGTSKTAMYYFGSDGVAYTNGWKTIDGSKYFFNGSGRLHYGWRTASDGNKYYCDPTTGVMQTGWKTINGKKYFFNNSGRLHYGWRTASDGNKYYCDPDTGVMQTGWLKINGKYYFFNNSGRLHYGWRTASDGNKYYCDPTTGVMQTGWKTINGKTYFFNNSGRLHYGWRTASDGSKYYCDTKTGVMQTGWVTINGKKYYFYSDGRLKV